MDSEKIHFIHATIQFVGIENVAKLQKIDPSNLKVPRADSRTKTPGRQKISGEQKYQVVHKT